MIPEGTTLYEALRTAAEAAEHAKLDAQGVHESLSVTAQLSERR
jgi:hypothetical protein